MADDLEMSHKTLAAAIQDLLGTTDYVLWMAAAGVGFDRHARGFVLTDVQRIAMATWVASGMIGNRGFFDHSLDEMADWAKAYEDLELPLAAEAIRQAARIMPTIDWERSDPRQRQLDPLERQYYSQEDRTKAAIGILVRMKPNDAFAGLDQITTDPAGWVRRVLARSQRG